MKNFEKHGYRAVMNELRDFLTEKYPITYQDGPRLSAAQRRKNIQDDTIRRFAGRARLPLTWRKKFAERLGVPEYIVADATNLIVERMEKELTKGNSVLITGFGDIRVHPGVLRKTISFTPDKEWIHAINSPTSTKDIGLLRRVDSRGRLVPRTDV